MFRLDGKTALVTGASQGIGKAIALRLASQGAKVVIAARRPEKLIEVANEVQDAGGEAYPLTLDISNAEEVGDRVAGLPSDCADIDILVNNAGITADGLLARMSLDQWQRVMQTNLTGTYAVTRSVTRGMLKRRWGRIITISSVIGMMGNPGQTNYAAAKAGVIGFSKSLAKELGSRHITVNVVAPGFVATAMTDSLSADARKALISSVPLRDVGTVHDIASSTLFLASDEARYITGHVLNVSGGLYM